MNAADKLLARLDGVRQTGNGTWRARCPAHNGKSQSLSVRETPAGAVLLHCFAGCGADAVLGAVGLSLRDLYPEPLPLSPGEMPRPQRIQAADVLAALRVEVEVVLCAASDVANGEALSAEDMERLRLAVSRIRAGVANASR